MRRERREKKVASVRASGGLKECECCFSDDCLPEDMFACAAEKHRYCRDCVTTHADTQVGEGESSFCLNYIRVVS